ncbi:MAG: flavodoxin family protein [Actinomycetota bacterium]|nr:flavodoxin family protein [Actinomycetota bacterium]
MKIAVMYQSLRGGTRRAAEALGKSFQSQGAAVGIYPVTNIDAQFVLDADLLVIGTWTDGLFGLGAKPAQIGKLNTLPDISQKKAAIFVTYEISPKKSLQQFAEWANERGASLIHQQGFKVRGPFRTDISEEIENFTRKSIASVTSQNA